MQLSRSLAAAWAAFALAATAAMPEHAHARDIVGFPAAYAPGTVVVKTSERSLYYVLGYGRAVRYPVGVGRAGKQWSGTAIISGKFLRPAWTPPAEVRHDRPDLPNVIPGGTGRNPMGAAALVLSLHAAHPDDERSAPELVALVRELAQSAELPMPQV